MCRFQCSPGSGTNSLQIPRTTILIFENFFPFYSFRAILSLLSSIRDTYQLKDVKTAINPNKLVSKVMNHFPLQSSFSAAEMVITCRRCKTRSIRELLISFHWFHSSSRREDGQMSRTTPFKAHGFINAPLPTSPPTQALPQRISLMSSTLRHLIPNSI